MKRILFLLLGLLVHACTSYDDTPEPETPTPVTFGDWQPAFSNQTESFTQTRAGSDGSSQSRTITVSTTITNLTDIYEMEDNNDINDDGDLFDIAQSRNITYNTSPDVGTFSNSSVDIVHNNNGTNQIIYNGESYPINFLSIFKEDTDDDDDYILGFHQFSAYYFYKPIPNNKIFFFLESDNSNDLSLGKYETKYFDSQIDEIQIPFGFTQTSSDKYLTLSDTEFHLGQLDFEPFIDFGYAEGRICGNGSVPYFTPEVDDCGNPDNPFYDRFYSDILNAEIHYKEFNERFFISIKGVDYAERPFQIFYYDNQHIYLSENNSNGTCYGGIDEYTYNNISLPNYQNFMPYTTLQDGNTIDCQDGDWFDLNQPTHPQFFAANYAILSEGQIQSVISEDIIIERLYTMPITGGWIDFYQNTFGYTPQQVNVAKLKLLDLQGPEHPAIEVYYNQYGYVEFLRVGINDASTPSGFHMYNFEYDYWKYLNQETKDYITGSNGTTDSFNIVDETIGFYLSRYIKDLRNDAILTF